MRDYAGLVIESHIGYDSMQFLLEGTFLGCIETCLEWLTIPATCKSAGSLLADLPEYFLKYNSFAQWFYHGGSCAFVKGHTTWKMTETDIFFAYSSDTFSSGTRGNLAN